MTLHIETPALLFSATSLILLAYTNRFLTIAQIVRSLKKHYDEKPHQKHTAANQEPQPKVVAYSVYAIIRRAMPVPFGVCHAFAIFRATAFRDLSFWRKPIVPVDFAWNFVLGNQYFSYCSAFASE